MIDATAHRRAWRDLARAVLPSFTEVQLVCPLDVCRAREANRPRGNAPRGVYAAAGQPGSTVPGVDVPYEPALDPDLVLDTAREDVATAVAKIVSVALKLAGSRPPEAPSYPGPAWAIWVTGLPGSGKTTLAAGIAAGMSNLGLPIVVLELVDVHEFVLDARPAVPADEDILHRALVVTAAFLTKAGIPVIIDATAPHREWRHLARALIERFAEIQLLCPHELCMERERAARWCPVMCAHGGRRNAVLAAAPDIAMAYEQALDAELTLWTDVRAVSSVVHDALILARRLHHQAAGAPSRRLG